MKYLVFCSDSERLPSILQKVDKNQTFILQNNLQSSLPCFKDNTFEQIILHVSNVEEIDQNLSHTIYSILKPDGNVILSHDSQADAIQALKDRLTIGGFKLENTEEQNTVIIKKPSWAGKGVASLKKKTNGNSTENKVKIENSNDVTKKANPFAKVTVNDNTSELIDEDNLLSNESEYKKIEKPEDCSTKPKACKNCSCGRAEMEANVSNLAENIEKGKVTSSCGNCYLGDAFRCSTCPYKGLPAFKPGDKVKLDLSNDSVGGVLNEGNKVLVTGGKVKLQI